MTALFPRGKAVIPIGLLLTSCAVGPNYHPPSPPPPVSGPFVSLAPDASIPQPAPGAWWRLYDDPVLDRLVERALAANNDLKVAAANLAYAQALAAEAGAGLFPTTGVDAGASYGKSLNQGGAPGPAGMSYSAGLTAAYQIDLFGRVRRAIEAARADVEAQAAAVNAVRITVAAQTAGAYANACAFAAEAAVARASVARVQQTYDILLRQRAAGAISDLDVARQAALLEQEKATVPVLDSQRRAALFELAVLTGAPPAQYPPEAAVCQVAPRLRTPLPVGDGAALLARRPDVREAERRLAAATARIGVATADLYPTISLNGAVSTAARSIGALASPATTAFSLGPLLTWSFPNLLAARARVRGADAQSQAALATFDATVLTALKETETTLTTYAAALEAHAALARAKADADEALRLATLQSTIGTLSFLDLLTAQAVALEADRALAASDQNLVADQIAVFQALGGGWQDAPPIAAPKDRGA